jgi:hypothetical protein
MAGEWIKVEKATPDKPEILRMARELCIDRDAVFGKLILIWMWFDQNSVDGVVDGAVDADVDAVVRMTGFASVMRSVGWLFDKPDDEADPTIHSTHIPGLALPNFDRHNGETAKKRALRNDRQAKWRSKSVDVYVDAHVDTTSSTKASTREEKRREEKIKKESRRATRLPSDWQPSEILKAWAFKERPDLEISTTIAKFVDHWRAAPGSKGVKLDWDATFRNWVRGERQGVRIAPPDYSAVIATLKD